MGIVLLFISYFFTNFSKIGANIVIPYFVKSMGLSSSMGGFLTSIYFLPYGIMQLVSGTLSRKYGSIKFVAYCSILTVAGALVFGFAENWIMLFVGRLLMGFGTGPIFAALIQYETEHYTGSKYAKVAGISFTVSNMGSVCAVAPLKAMVEKYGPKITFIAVAVIIAIVDILLFSKSEKKNDKEIKISALATQIAAGTRKSLSSKYLLWGGIVWISYVGIHMTYTGMWCTEWAKQAFPGQFSLAGINGSVLSVFVMIGCLVSEYVHNRKKYTSTGSSINATSAIAIAFIMVVAMHIVSYFWLSLICLCCMGFFIGHLCVQGVAMCKDKSDCESNSTVIGIWNMVSSIWVMVMQWISGVMLEGMTYNKVAAIFALMFLLVAVGFRISCHEDSRVK